MHSIWQVSHRCQWRRWNNLLDVNCIFQIWNRQTVCEFNCALAMTPTHRWHVLHQCSWVRRRALHQRQRILPGVTDTSAVSGLLRHWSSQLHQAGVIVTGEARLVSINYCTLMYKRLIDRCESLKDLRKSRWLFFVRTTGLHSYQGKKRWTRWKHFVTLSLQPKYMQSFGAVKG